MRIPSFFIAVAFMASPTFAGLVTFEDVGAGLPADGFYNGGPTSNSNGWSSGGVFFENTFTDFGGGFTGWQGWAYSKVKDRTTAGFTNQYAAFSTSGTNAGHGAGNSETYGMAFAGSVKDANGSALNFNGQANVHSIDLTNATYSVLAFRDGNDGGFGGAVQYQAGDFFNLRIDGFDGDNATGNNTGHVDVSLANFTATGLDFIDDWTNVDLSSLGTVRSLQFSLDSNIFETFPPDPTEYLNTPAYVAVDNLSFTAVPEPSSFALVGIACMGLWRRRG